MNNTETGGPAFPYGDPTHGGDSGMTLSDYFAAKGMRGLRRIFYVNQCYILKENV